MRGHSPVVIPTHPRVAELDRLGDEMAELSAHLDAATARLLALIRESDARGGWNTGFREVEPRRRRRGIPQSRCRRRRQAGRRFN